MRAAENSWKKDNETQSVLASSAVLISAGDDLRPQRTGREPEIATGVASSASQSDGEARAAERQNRTVADKLHTEKECDRATPAAMLASLTAEQRARFECANAGRVIGQRSLPKAPALSATLRSFRPSNDEKEDEK